ncbi:MAG TPA: hypothetical protein VN859_00935 [Steroidobacteraceae bacterium]|nr:hypothetical protein [Steroidobacteraceae bacterium]
MSRIHLSVISRCRAGALASALAVSLLASCVTVTTAPSDSRLSGHWVLDPAASDDAGVRIAQALADARKKMRARRPGGPGDGAGSSGSDVGGGGGGGGGGGRHGPRGPGSGPDQGGGQGQASAPEPAPGGAARTGGGDDALPDSIIDQYGNTRLLGPDLRALATNLVHAVAGPRELELEIEDDTVRVRTDGLPAREYRLGEGFSRFDEYGTAHMLPSWSGDAFVLRARYANGASITERYEVLRGQSVLTRTVELVDPIIGKLQLHGLYRAAPR